jgi:hypothetical protein
MKVRIVLAVCTWLLSVASIWGQVDTAPAQPAPAVAPAVIDAQSNGPQSIGPQSNGDPMLTPPAVSGQFYPTSFTSEERSNYLRGGLAFTTAYTDNALGSLTGEPVSDISYSIAPMVALEETTGRMRAELSYAPGFTFYQRTSERNEQDQNASVNFQYRLSPHVTFSAQDGFQKSSNIFNQPDLASAATVSGTIEQANFSVIAPIADRLGNAGNVGIAYQFARNAMVGASATFTNLYYPDQSEVPGLFNAASQAGSVFYTLRVARRNYLGVTYEYQRLLAYPAEGTNETETQAALLFYTVYPTSRFSISLFGGPQYSNAGPQFSTISSVPTGASQSWNPAAGGSLNWQGRRSALAFSYAHMISSGGGLIGAVRLDSASATVRQQLSRTLTASVSGGYAQNYLLAGESLSGYDGHTVSGTAALQQQLRQHWNLQLGYTRLHEDYSTVAVLAMTPNTNREFVSVSYQFSRPLGR